ncbi:MAG: hypothetical protein HQM03_22190 [Magnetococcales bacterium]|nr:hypothetical protein [Magnetococcales bacterium]
MLTPKQDAFRKAYMETGNAETAYRTIYNCSGMSPGHVLSHLLPSGKTRYGKFLIGDVEGNPGDSMVVELTGPKAGMWFDHATGQGGDILDLWAVTRGWDARSDFPRLLEDVAAWLGETPFTNCPKPTQKTPPVDELVAQPC